MLNEEAKIPKSDENAREKLSEFNRIQPPKNREYCPARRHDENVRALLFSGGKTVQVRSVVNEYQYI